MRETKMDDFFIATRIALVATLLKNGDNQRARSELDSLSFNPCYALRKPIEAAILKSDKLFDGDEQKAQVFIDMLVNLMERASRH